MNRALKILAAAVAILTLAFSVSWSQPGGGGRSRGGGGGGGMSAEQLLGFLALNPEVALGDEALLALRAALRDTYAEQQEMRESFRGGGGDPQEVPKTMVAMRRDMMAAVNGILTEAQREILAASMDRQQGGRGGGGR